MPSGVMDAVPIYMGGKRHLLDRIFAGLAELGLPQNEGYVLADPFMGGGSVALRAKWLGYRVLANDVSARSEAVGKALIENDRITLADADLLAAFEFDPDDWWQPPVHKLPWPDPARDLMAQLVACAETYGEPKRSMFRALMLKFATRISMWGQPIALEPGGRIRREEWDAMTKPQVDRIPAFTEPRRFALSEARKLNGGVFASEHRNAMHRMDAIDFLERVGDTPDAAYFDPPYPEVEHYERHYWAIDGLLDNAQPEGAPSRFSRAGGWKHLADVFDAAEAIPVWIVSMGDRAQEEELLRLLTDRGRSVEEAQIPGAHIQSKSNKSRDRHELLLVAQKE